MARLTDEEMMRRWYQAHSEADVSGLHYHAAQNEVRRVAAGRALVRAGVEQAIETLEEAVERDERHPAYGLILHLRAELKAGKLV